MNIIFLSNCRNNLQFKRKANRKLCSSVIGIDLTVHSAEIQFLPWDGTVLAETLLNTQNSSHGMITCENCIILIYVQK